MKTLKYFQLGTLLFFCTTCLWFKKSEYHKSESLRKDTVIIELDSVDVWRKARLRDYTEMMFTNK